MEGKAIKTPPDELIVRPSKMPQLANCPYAFINCLGWEERTEDADRGSAMHYAMAYGVEKALEDGWNIDEDDKKTVKYLRSVFVEGQTDDGETLLQELQVSVVNGDVEVTRGTLDYLLLNKDKTEGLLIDWKFGKKKVNNGPTNLQLQAYTEGAFQKVETLKKLRVMIIQPAVMTEDEIENQEGFRITREQSANNFLPNVSGIEEAARAATVRDAVPSNDNCKFCNKMNCPAWRQMCEDALRILMGGEKSIELTTKYGSKASEEEVLEYADKGLDLIAEAEDFLKEKKKTLTDYVIGKGGSQNYMVTSSKRTTVKWEIIAKELGATMEDIARNTEKKESAPFLRRRTKRITEWN